MIRTQIQLEEQVWEKLRERAFLEKRSMADFVRAVMRKELSVSRPERKRRWLSVEDFTFIGSGASQGKGSGTIAERHDEELAKAIEND